jgi:hypothetical protein
VFRSDSEVGVSGWAVCTKALAYLITCWLRLGCYAVKLGELNEYQRGMALRECDLLSGICGLDSALCDLIALRDEMAPAVGAFSWLGR